MIKTSGEGGVGGVGCGCKPDGSPKDGLDEWSVGRVRIVWWRVLFFVTDHELYSFLSGWFIRPSDEIELRLLSVSKNCF